MMDLVEGYFAMIKKNRLLKIGKKAQVLEVKGYLKSICFNLHLLNYTKRKRRCI